MLLDAQIEGKQDHGWRGAEGEGQTAVTIIGTVDTKAIEPKVSLKLHHDSGETALYTVDLEDLLLMAKGLAAGAGLSV